jgi:hypothetical protein
MLPRLPDPDEIRGFFDGAEKLRTTTLASRSSLYGMPGGNGRVIHAEPHHVTSMSRGSTDTMRWMTWLRRHYVVDDVDPKTLCGG